jgi:carboxymethylenebutenolidase
MCFDGDSSPPIPVISGGALTHEDLVLEASDGTRFAAFAALPGESPGAGAVILPDVRGLYRFYEELALRFAERGYAAIAIDYFGRTAGVDKRGDDFEYRPHVEQTTPEGVQADVAAAVGWLREHGCKSVFTVGFCFGGRNSWLAAASGHALAGAIGFYGRPPVEVAARMEAPILALQAGADQNISARDNVAFDGALTEAGIEHAIVTFEGAPHSFFDRKQEDFAEASADAWRRVLEFVERHRS